MYRLKLKGQGKKRLKVWKNLDGWSGYFFRPGAAELPLEKKYRHTYIFLKTQCSCIIQLSCLCWYNSVFSILSTDFTFFHWPWISAGVHHLWRFTRESIWTSCCHWKVHERQRIRPNVQAWLEPHLLSPD